MAGRFEHTSQFHSRENRKGRLDPTFNLFRNTTLVAGDSPVTTGDLFSAAKRAEPVTFKVGITRGAPAPNGIIFEFGSAARGIALYIDDDTLGFVAGSGSGTTDFCAITTGAFFTATGQEVEVVCSVNPGTGEGRVWVKGEEKGRNTATTPAFLWSDTGPGAIGDVATSVTARVPAGQRVTLANLTLTTPLSVYSGQRPRQFS